MTERTLEALNKEADRQLAIFECKNLVNKAIFNGAAWLNKRNLALWADRDDDKLEMPWGIYDGKKGVERYYLQDLGDRADDGELEKIKGCMRWYSTDTPVVVVAGDGQTAKGLWTSPGVDTYREGDAHPDGYWRWGYYAVDFILEDGSWKIWHATFYPLFRTKYEEAWTKAPAYDKALIPVTPDRPREAPLYHYSPDAVYADYAPEIPQPYETF